MAEIFVLYHADCVDGFTAAYYAYRGLQKPAHYVPLRYGDPLPEIPDGSKVYMLDYTISRADTEALQQRLGYYSVVVLDHHQSAVNELAGMEWPVVIDTSKSGAMLARQWWFGFDKQPPMLAQYVQDRDLWRWELPSSEEVSAHIGSLEFDWDVWEALETDLECSDTFDRVVMCGRAVLRAQQRMIERISENTRFCELDGWAAALVNSPVLGSEVGAAVLESFPEAQIALVWAQRSDGQVRVSVRSRADGPDVAAIAEKRGGGGHRHAAGFVLPHYDSDFVLQGQEQKQE